MKTYSRLTLAFLLLVLFVPQVGADEPPENGKHVEYYENGKKKSETHYKNGEEEGLSTVWYYNGQKAAERHYKNGKQDGPWTAWHENGQKQVEGHFKNGEEEGLGTGWYENGQKWHQTHYKNGKQDGLVTGWHANGQKKLEAHFKNGEKDGLWTQWYNNGQNLSESHYKDGKRDGLWTSWYPNGQKKSEDNFKDGKKDGVETSWHENGQKAAERHYKNGKQDGLHTHWHANGQKEEKHFKNDQLHGLWTSWYPNGQKAGESHYKNGKKDGVETSWHENGQKAAERHYKDGKKDGVETSWHENGQKKLEAHFKNGEKDGLWTQWYNNGQKEREAHYKNGKKHGLFVDWHRNGTKYKTSRYRDPAFHLKEIKKATENRSRVNHKKISKSKEFMLRKSEFLRVHGTIDKKEYQQLFNGFCDQGDVPNCAALAAFGVIPKDFREDLFRCSFKRVPEGWEVRIPFGRSDAQVLLVKPEDLQPQTAQGSGKTWEPAGTSLGWQILEAAYILHVYKRDPNGKMNLQGYMKFPRHDPDKLSAYEILDLLLPTDDNQKKIIGPTSSKNKHFAKRLQGEMKLALKTFDPRVDMYVASSPTWTSSPLGGTAISSHAYTINAVKNNRILLFNPHDDRKPIVISHKMFMKQVLSLYCVTLDCNELFR